jgi:Flp pilus assembly protein TadG
MSGERESGQATIELALLLPVLIFLALVLVQIGLLASDNVRLWHAAREAARVGSVDDDPAAISDAADHAGLSPISVRVEPLPQDRVQGEPLTVHVTYRPGTRIPVLGRLIGRTELSATATMRIEQP